MGYYAIGIGGTGAKCLESLIHLAAAGMMPKSDELHVLFVDPDVANGSRARVEETLNHYVECKKRFELGQTDLLKTKIDRADPPLSTPFRETNPSLNKFFHYANFRDSSAGKLFDVLYSSLEKESTLEEGFRGHSSIGSAVMAKTVDFQKDETWRVFRDKISNDGGEAKVFLTASIFGGTGASGFPTIARIVEEKLDVKIGGALLLPYFQFTDDGKDDTLKAKSDEFLMNTQTALKHYYRLNQTGNYDAVYLFGDESRTNVENALGGTEQNNAPHFIELYAALAAIHFFGTNSTGDGTRYFMIGRAKDDQLQWTDLPDDNGGETVRLKLRQLERFAIAYLSVYRPAVQEIVKCSKDDYRAPWFVNFFDGIEVATIKKAFGVDKYAKDQVNYVANYCRAFLLWLANVQGNYGGNKKIELIDYKVYAEKQADGDSLGLKLPENFSLDRNVMNKLWKRMCEGPKKGNDAQGVGKFLQALYNNCGK